MKTTSYKNSQPINPKDEFLYLIEYDTDPDGFMRRRELRQDKYGKRRQGWND